VKRISFLHLMVLLFFVMNSGLTQTPATGKKMLVGVLPVFDASGDVYSEVLTQHMTFMLFKELQGPNIQPELLNPGGAYTPLDSDLIREFGKMAGVDAVVFTTLQATDKPRNGKWTLHVESQVMDIKSGRLSEAAKHSQEIESRDTKIETFYVSPWSAFLPGVGGTGGSRPFEKQPIGKKTRDLARLVSAASTSDILNLTNTYSASPLPANPGKCEVKFNIAYTARKTISKAYELVANDQEQSLWIKDGYVRFTASGGILFFHFRLQDAPYRMPVQHVYHVSTFLDCNRPENNLTFEIGPSGEGFVRWH
jgi:hypothetical protein